MQSLQAIMIRFIDIFAFPLNGGLMTVPLCTDISMSALCGGKIKQYFVNDTH